VNTPIYAKENPDDPLPDDKLSYLVSSTGMFLCRRHEWFVSATPIRTWPSDLAPQTGFLEPSYPVVPQVVFERLCGFFRAMAEEHGCEAGAYLVVDRKDGTVDARVPGQIATMREGWRGRMNAVGLEYDSLTDLGPGDAVLGTVHSHVFGPAYASGVDVHDEVDKPGVHIVVGHVDRDPPDFSVEAVVDGERFRLDPESVIEDFAKPRDDFPPAWREAVRVEVQPRWGSVYGASSYDVPRATEDYR